MTYYQKEIWLWLHTCKVYLNAKHEFPIMHTTSTSFNQLSKWEVTQNTVTYSASVACDNLFPQAAEKGLLSDYYLTTGLINKLVQPQYIHVGWWLTHALGPSELLWRYFNICHYSFTDELFNNCPLSTKCLKSRGSWCHGHLWIQRGCWVNPYFCQTTCMLTAP